MIQSRLVLPVASTKRRFVAVAIGMCSALSGTSWGAQKISPMLVPSESVAQILVKEPSPQGLQGSHRMESPPSSPTQMQIQRWSASALMPMAHVRVMADGAHVLRLPRPLTSPEAQDIARRMLASGQFESVEPDYRVHPAAYSGADPRFADQWNLASPSSVPGGANLAQAWKRSPGPGAVNVAILDTGLTGHPDIAAANLLPGYDFLSAATLTSTPDSKTGGYLGAGFVKNDGIAGRDPDPSDPGDWVTASDAANYPQLCGLATPSSWHGTYVAGIVAAGQDNGIGIAGINPTARVMMARVLGRCGGVTSDVIDALYWVAGLAVPGMPVNPNPARVVNMSLGAYAPCTSIMQGAVNAARAAGVVVIAATGNNGASAIASPANCSGVIGVTAHTADGDNADYANVGAGTALSAPGGGAGSRITGTQRSVLSLSNTGTTVPVDAGYATSIGTSVAAPHVTGVVSLMLSANPQLTPADVLQLLQQSARPFPPGTYCQQVNVQCGAGMLDADAAVALASGLPVVQAGATGFNVLPGTTVTLSANGGPGYGRTVQAIEWTQTSGPGVNLVPVDSSHVSATLAAEGSYGFRATLRNDSGVAASSDLSVVSRVVVSSSPATTPAQPAPTGTTASAPEQGSGGGGALSPLFAAALIALGFLCFASPKPRRSL